MSRASSVSEHAEQLVCRDSTNKANMIFDVEQGMNEIEKQR